MSAADNIYAISRDDYDSDEDYAQALLMGGSRRLLHRKEHLLGAESRTLRDTLKAAILPTGTVLWVDETPDGILAALRLCGGRF